MCMHSETTQTYSKAEHPWHATSSSPIVVDKQSPFETQPTHLIDVHYLGTSWDVQDNQVFERFEKGWQHVDSVREVTPSHVQAVEL